MSGTDIRVADLPDLGAVTDASSIVADVASGTGRFSALSLKAYCATTTMPEAPFTNSPYGRQNGAWTAVLGDAPSNSVAYARMNAAWTPVIPEAPFTGSIYGRGGGAWTPVLPMTGGTIGGNLGATGNLTAGAGVYTNSLSMSSANSYEWVFQVQGGTGDHQQVHRAGWIDTWASVNGTRLWHGPGGQLMSLDGNGVLTASGAVWQTPGVFGFKPGGQGRIFYFAPTYYLEWNSTTGQTTYVSNGTPMWNMRASDGMCFNSVNAVGGVGPYLNTSDRGTKTGIAPSTKGLAEVLQLQPVSFIRDYPGAPAGGPEEIGFVAQDVQPIVPEAVWQAGMVMTREGEPALALSESTLTALNVNAIKELNDLIGALTARIAALEAA